MLNGKKILALIPARGGSKGIPHKNIVDLNGKPLINWTIEAALKSKYVDYVFVSSDDDKILEVSKKAGATPLKRPADISNDLANSESVVEHAISTLETDTPFDYILFLQPTSPLRDAGDIDSALEVFGNGNSTFDALISVYEPEHSPFKCFVLNSSGVLEGLVNNQAPFQRRQDLPKAFMPNGAIYILKKEKFKARKRFFYEDSTIPFLMPKEKSIDIDSLADIKMASELLK